MSASKRVLVTESLDAAGIERMEAEDLTVDVKLGLQPDELRREIRGAAALIVRSQTKVTPELIDAADELKIIGRAGAGYDNIDLDAATRRGIIVANAPGGNSVSAAEHAIALLLGLTRQIVPAHRSMAEGRWERKSFVGSELRRKLIGVIGLGRVGLEVARRLRAFDAKIAAYDPFVSRERAEEFGVQLMEIDDLVKIADVLTLHLPRTDETKNLLSAERIAAMKPSARLVNCARGGLVDEGALYEALAAGKLAGAAFDVFQTEPPEDRRLFELPNFIGTPHIAAHTEEAQKEVSIIIAKQVVKALSTGMASNALNIPPISEELLSRLQPYILLGERLGTLLGHFSECGITDVHVAYRGEIQALDLRIVTASILKKILEPAVGESVNYVNALSVARERGIRFEESRSPEAEDYSSVISIEIRSGDVEHSVAGTLFQKNKPRIVQLDRYPLEARPEGVLLVMTNRDVPGVIGRVGSVLGRYGINVAEFRLGRTVIGGEAISVLNLDNDVEPEALSELLSLENVTSARVIRFATEPSAPVGVS